jgi:hypothetical protein
LVILVVRQYSKRIYKKNKMEKNGKRNYLGIGCLPINNGSAHVIAYL